MPLIPTLPTQEENADLNIEYTIEGMLSRYGRPSTYLSNFIENLCANKLATKPIIINSTHEEERKKFEEWLLYEQNFMSQFNKAIKRSSTTGYAIFGLDYIMDRWTLILANTLIAPIRQGNSLYVEGTLITPIIKGQKNIFIISEKYLLNGIERNVYTNSNKTEVPSSSPQDLSELGNNWEKTTFADFRSKVGKTLSPFVSHIKLDEPLIMTLEAQLPNDPVDAIIGYSDTYAIQQDLYLLDLIYGYYLLLLHINQRRIVINKSNDGTSNLDDIDPEWKRLIQSGIALVNPSELFDPEFGALTFMEAVRGINDEAYNSYLTQLFFCLEKIGFNISRGRQAGSQKAKKEISFDTDLEHSFLTNKIERYQFKLTSYFRNIAKILGLNNLAEDLTVTLSKLDIENKSDEILNEINKFTSGVQTRAGAIQTLEGIPQQTAEDKAREIEAEQMNIMKMTASVQGQGQSQGDGVKTPQSVSRTKGEATTTEKRDKNIQRQERYVKEKK